MKPPRRATPVYWLLALVTVWSAPGCAPSPRSGSPIVAGGRSVIEQLSPGDVTGFARAVEPRPFVFPADHGPHPDFRTEWWYLTGHLESKSGRRFGYQLTIFRNALSPEMGPRSSAWATRQVYMGHFALTDVGGRRFRSFERFARGALGLAGARPEPLEVWVESWRIEGLDSREAPLRLSAAGGDVEIELTLLPGKPPVPQGDGGLSQKGAAAGNASYYYSLTRMPTEGRLSIGDEPFVVHGTSWMDREWSTSALDADQVGWDWFSLQLADQTELMYYRLRETDGATSRFSAGSYIGPSGEVRRLGPDEVLIEELATWTSPESGTTYPSRWRLSAPSLGIDLEVEPLLASQELRHTFFYWEGAVEVEGRGPDGALAGQGYVELTGY